MGLGGRCRSSYLGGDGEAMSAGLVALGLGALVLVARRKTGEDAMGWTKKSSSVVITSDARTFLDALAGRLSFPIVVTSGQRSAAQQASAMLAKLAKGDTLQDLLDLYADDSQVQALYALGTDAGAWTATIQSYADRGRPISDHLKAKAVDIRTRDLSSAQVQELQKAAQALGAETVLESDHLHLEDWA